MKTQTREVRMNRDEVKIFVNQNNFFAGIINKEKRIFYHVPRSAKNLFHLFGFDGLGINEEILLRKDFDVIKVKYQDKILVTNRLKWLNKGIVSPYCNSIVDKQIILNLSEITPDNPQHVKNQYNIFSEAV